MNQGFSLTEVLVSLLLITSASLALLKQQWQVSQLFNQIHTRTNVLSQFDNAVERLEAGYSTVAATVPVRLQHTRIAQIITAEISWMPPSLSKQVCCMVKRELVVG